MIGRTSEDFVTVKDVPAWDFITAYADHLKKTNTIKIPENYDLIKTGVAKELAPYNDDWYFIRAAAVARRVYLRPRIGVGRMKHLFGGKKNNGYSRSHHAKVAGGNIRSALHALEDAGVLMRTADKRNKSLNDQLQNENEAQLCTRMVTPEGQRTLNEIARTVLNRLMTAN